MKGPLWTPRAVALRFEEAARTLCCLPGVIPRAKLSSWPAIIRTYWELYCDGEARPRRFAATPKSVTEMDETLEWLRWVDPKYAKVIWSRACHIPWRLMAERLGVSRQTVSEYYKRGLEIIAARLNQEKARLNTNFPATPFAGL